MNARRAWSRSVTALVLVAGALAAACGGGCPERPCPVCPSRAAEAAAAPARCIEEWVHLPVVVPFATGAVELDAQGRAVLAEVAREVQRRSDVRRVRVEGHTGACGVERNNMALSQRRAEGVVVELASLGSPREMLEAIGYGTTQSRAAEACDPPGDEALGQANRRVELSVLVCRDGTAGGAAP